MTTRVPLGYCTYEDCGIDLVNASIGHEHCADCGKLIELDNCDGDMRDGRMVGYAGSTQGTDDSGEWLCNSCHDQYVYQSGAERAAEIAADIERDLA